MFNKEGGNYFWLSYCTNFRGHNIGWRTDYIFVSEKLGGRVEDAIIHKDCSDHVPVGMETNL